MTFRTRNFPNISNVSVAQAGMQKIPMKNCVFETKFQVTRTLAKGMKSNFMVIFSMFMLFCPPVILMSWTHWQKWRLPKGQTALLPPGDQYCRSGTTYTIIRSGPDLVLRFDA